MFPVLPPASSLYSAFRSPPFGASSGKGRRSEILTTPSPNSFRLRTPTLRRPLRAPGSNSALGDWLDGFFRFHDFFLSGWIVGLNRSRLESTLFPPFLKCPPFQKNCLHPNVVVPVPPSDGSDLGMSALFPPPPPPPRSRLHPPPLAGIVAFFWWEWCRMFFPFCLFPRRHVFFIYLCFPVNPHSAFVTLPVGLVFLSHFFFGPPSLFLFVPRPRSRLLSPAPVSTLHT